MDKTQETASPSGLSDWDKAMAQAKADMDAAGTFAAPNPDDSPEDEGDEELGDAEVADPAGPTEDEDDEDDEDEDEAPGDGQEVPADESTDEPEPEVQDGEREAPAEEQGGSRNKKRLAKLHEDNEKLQAELNEVKSSLDDKVKEAVEEANRKADEARAATRELELKQSAYEAETQAAAAVVSEMTGTQDEVRELIAKVKRGDPLAAERLEEIEQNQTKLSALMQYAQAQTNERLGKVYISSVKDLPNVDKAVIEDAHIPTVTRHLHEAGVVTGRSESQTEIDRLNGLLEEKDEEIKVLNDKLVDKPAKGSKTSTQTSKRLPGGGRPVESRRRSEIEDELFGPDGLPRPGAFEDIKAGKLKIFGR